MFRNLVSTSSSYSMLGEKCGRFQFCKNPVGNFLLMEVPPGSTRCGRIFVPPVGRGRCASDGDSFKLLLFSEIEEVGVAVKCAPVRIDGAAGRTVGHGGRPGWRTGWPDW